MYIVLVIYHPYVFRSAVCGSYNSIIRAVCGVFTLLIVYIKLKYYTLHGPIPGLSPHFLFGNLIQSGQLMRDVSLPQVCSTFKARFGDVFQFWFGPSRFIVVSGINDVQHIFTHRTIYDQGDIYIQQFGILAPNGLITLKGSSILPELRTSTISFRSIFLGAKFKRHAAITLPLFRRAKIITNLDIIVTCTDQLLTIWRVRRHQHVHLDIVQQCQNLLLEIFGLIAFDYDLETLNDDGETSNKELTKALHDLLSTFEKVIFAPSIIASIYTKLSRRHQRAKTIIERHLRQMIERELAESPESITQRKRTCLIASLVASLQKNEKVEASKSEEEKRGLSQQEVINEMFMFLIAGFETTSTALAWFIHFMSKYPRVQQKIKNELTMINSNKQDLSIECLDSLVFLDCVINEVLRFFPPINGTVRTLIMDDRLPESGTQLYKGDSVLIAFHNLARDTRYWSIDPESFYPERFLGEDKNHHPYALIPFGNGHRQCIGNDLARFELKVIVARMLQHVTFGDGGAEINSGGHLTRITVMPKHVGVTIKFDQEI